MKYAITIRVLAGKELHVGLITRWKYWGAIIPRKVSLSILNCSDTCYHNLLEFLTWWRTCCTMLHSFYHLRPMLGPVGGAALVSYQSGPPAGSQNLSPPPVGTAVDNSLYRYNRLDTYTGVDYLRRG